MTSTNRTLAQVEAEIAAVKAQIDSVHGEETEVYARIVGYYRAVKNWNKGKRDEFNHRKLFELKDEVHSPYIAERRSVELAKEDIATANVLASVSEVNAPKATGSWHYELFTRPGCPHCPPVASFIENSGFSGESINVDTEDGINLAAERGVFSTPTVILYDENGNAFARAHTVDELTAITSSKEQAIA